MVETNSVVLDRMIRTGACGTWWSAFTRSGYPLGLLQLEAGLLAAPAARERVAAAVAAVREVNPTGVLRTTELVVEAGRAWLVVAAAPGATVADLLACGVTLDAGSAAGIAVDVGQGLCNLHAAGLGHGDLAPETVILTRAGVATLVEVGVLAALRDAPIDASRDGAAWASLARDLARKAPAKEARALVAAAATARRGDLAVAVRQLAAAASLLPDFASRESLCARIATELNPPRPLTLRSTMDSRVEVRRSSGPVTPLRRRLPRAVQVAAMLLAIVLGVGAALWWLVLPHW